MTGGFFKRMADNEREAHENAPGRSLEALTVDERIERIRTLKHQINATIKEIKSVDKHYAHAEDRAEKRAMLQARIERWKDEIYTLRKITRRSGRR